MEKGSDVHPGMCLGSNSFQSAVRAACADLVETNELIWKTMFSQILVIGLFCPTHWRKIQSKAVKIVRSPKLYRIVHVKQQQPSCMKKHGNHRDTSAQPPYDINWLPLVELFAAGFENILHKLVLSLISHTWLAALYWDLAPTNSLAEESLEFRNRPGLSANSSKNVTRLVPLRGTRCFQLQRKPIRIHIRYPRNWLYHKVSDSPSGGRWVKQTSIRVPRKTKKSTLTCRVTSVVNHMTMWLVKQSSHAIRGSFSSTKHSSFVAWNWLPARPEGRWPKCWYLTSLGSEFCRISCPGIPRKHTWQALHRLLSRFKGLEWMLGQSGQMWSKLKHCQEEVLQTSAVVTVLIN